MKTFEVTVEHLLPGGAAWATGECGPVLLHHAVPGDRFIVRVTPQQRGLAQGQIIRLVEASPRRCEPPCPVAGECGGCALQAVQPSTHPDIKSDWVRRAFAPVWHTGVHWQGVLPCDEGRRRVRWHVDPQGRLGFYARESHQVVVSPSCMVLTPALQWLLQQWPLITAHFEQNQHPQAVYAVALENGIHIVLEYHKKPSQLPDIKHLDDAPYALQWWWRDGAACRPLHRPVANFYDAVPAGGHELLLDVGADDFVQGNRSGNRTMIEQVQSWCGDARRIVDLFSGIGNISLPLAMPGRTVHGFEMNPASVRASNHSAKRLQLPAHYDVYDLMGRFSTLPDSMIGADVLILDPPRKGAKQVCRQLNRLLPGSIIMIHCDPASAERDAVLAQQQGFRLQAVRGLDLFPFSGHVESMSLWRR